MPDGTPTTDQERARDRDLVDRLLASDDGAWREFHERFRPRIAACVRRAGVDDGDVEDASSFVLESLLADGCRRLGRWNGRASLSTYLYTVASHLAIDFVRQRPRVRFAGEEEIPQAPRTAPVVAEAERRALRAGLREAILACLFRLPNAADREILLLRYYAGLSAEEIGRHSSRKRNAVDQALSRAHRHLRHIAADVRPELLDYLGGDDLGDA